MFTDFEKYENIPQEWEPPTTQVEIYILIHNSDRIIKECAWDKIVEVGVCLKYTGRPTEIYKKAVKKILNKRGIIGIGGPFKSKFKIGRNDEINKKEHSNVLAVLLFSDKN